MKQQDFQTQFYRAVAQLPIDERVPYAFEQRVMMHLSTVVLDAKALWGRLLWRAVIPCLGVMVLTSVLASLTGETDSYAPDLESAVLAPIASEYENW